MRYTTIEQYSEAFWSKFIRHGVHGCLIWTGGSINSTGYASTNLPSILRHTTPKRTIKIARMAWYLERGYWSEQYVLHHCDTRLCCEIEHLYEGSQADNIRDVHDRPDYVPPRFTPEAVKEQMRQSYAEGITYVQLSAMYELSETTVWKIVTRRI